MAVPASSPSPDHCYNKPMSYGMQFWGDDIVLDCNGFAAASEKGMGSVVAVRPNFHTVGRRQTVRPRKRTL